MRKLIDYGLGALFITVIAFVGWHFYFSLPQIARHLPSKFAEGRVEFDRRIQERFPIGMPEPKLIQELRSLGFEGPFQGPNAKFAQIEKGGFPCNYLWRVIWNVDDEQKISRINGLYGGICL